VEKPPQNKTCNENGRQPSEITIMKRENFSSAFLSATIFRTVAALSLAMFLSGILASAATYSTIFRFSGVNGLQSRFGLVADSQGNFYGVTSSGGSNACLPKGCGVVFELSPTTGGGWTERVIYAFKGAPSDTAFPTTDLVFDTHGNLFGGTNSPSGAGAIFELTPSSGSAWTEKLIFNFSAVYFSPTGQLAFDSKGNLYGTVIGGPTFENYGGVYEISPQSNGTWQANLIHGFTNTNGDGYQPLGGVVVDGVGNVYGTTYRGGANNWGIVYELTPNSGTFTEKILHTFTNSTDGSYPNVPLMIDGSGNLYGTTTGGGPVDNPYGLVYELSPSGSTWTQTVLYNFAPYPAASGGSNVVFDSRGNLYGTTQAGGTQCNGPGCGTVFRLTPQTSGPWKSTTLHTFASAGDGSLPVAGVVLDSAGNIYGITEFGGDRDGKGTIFEIQP
jgi:uncharacterized repeat protein (TIGR03803 family)